MKKIIAVLSALTLCIILSISVFAADQPRLIDEADLLTNSEENALLVKLDHISQKYSFDVVVVTLEDYGGFDIDGFSGNYYDDHGYGFGTTNDGVILIISMAERDWVITSTGTGRDILNDDARSYIADQFYNDLHNGNYSSAFNTYADLCEKLLADAQNGKYYKTPFNAGMSAIIGAVIGLIAAAIVTGKMKGELKSVRMQSAASVYIKDNSLNITNSHDSFLYNTVTRVARPKENSSSRSSSSGSSHSSTHGKF